MNYIDLSIPIENGVASDPKGYEPKITYMRHGETFHQMEGQFPGLKPSDLPDEEAWALEFIELSTHNGTHMDAPYHFHSTQDGSLAGGPRRSLTIDELPLEWCQRPGVKLDFRNLPDGHVVTAAQVDEELDRIGHTLSEYDIVVVNTRAGKRYGEPDYIDAGVGMGREATLRLCAQGVRIVGTDAWSWDAPFSHTKAKWERDHDPSIIWEGHKAGREIGYFQMEKLHNLEALPSTGFTLSCFPVKIRDASAAWIRAVGIVPD